MRSCNKLTILIGKMRLWIKQICSVFCTWMNVYSFLAHSDVSFETFDNKPGSRTWGQQEGQSGANDEDSHFSSGDTTKDGFHCVPNYQSLPCPVSNWTDTFAMQASTTVRTVKVNSAPHVRTSWLYSQISIEFIQSIRMTLQLMIFILANCTLLRDLEFISSGFLLN